MTPERWQKVDGLLQAALGRAQGERAAFLAEACGGDEELRREVESLLSFHGRAEGFMEEPPYRAAAEALGGAPAESLEGRTLGRYQVERVIGRGGMGEVYLALDTQLGRRVALKLLPASFTSDAERVRRFRQEARAASALNHPGIVTIYEFGEAEGLRYLVNEYVEGRTLRELIEAGGLEFGQALEIAAQAAGALCAAHEAGIIHRDVKPENLMVRPDGYVKVLDFGLAKLNERAGAERVPGGDEAATLIKLSTQPGLVMGTVSYMSPEQARGLKVDARTDIWSLGVVLYETLTGRAPFDGETASDVLVSILSKEPAPLGECAPGVPEELRRVVGRALTKDRDERYQTMTELLGELREARDELAFRERGARRAGSHVAPPAAAARRPPTTDVGAARVSASQAAGDTARVEARTSGATLTPARAARRKAAVLLPLAAVALAACAAAVYFYTRREDSLAVLPFAYVPAEAGAAQDPEGEYLSDGLTESIIRDLSRLSGLRVIARSSVFRYKGRESDPREVGRELNVRTVLTGRIVQRGDVLTVNAELVEAETGTRLWGERYEVSVAGLLRVKGEIAGHVPGRLRLRLADEERRQLGKQHAVDPEAYRLYLKGRHLWNMRTPDALQKAVEHFRAAIERDPEYALAYAGLADAYSIMPFYGDTPAAVGYTQAREAALQALEKDEALAEGYTALARVLSEYDWDRPRAERTFARALELNPNYATARHWFGLFLADAGRYDEALVELRRARDLDPVSGSITSALGTVLYYAGRHDEAIVVLKQGIEIDPDLGGIRAHLGDVYRQQGRYAEAVEAYRQAAALFRVESPFLKARLAFARAKAGERAEALRLLEEIKRSPERYTQYSVASVYAALGNREQALAWLEKSFEVHDSQLSRLKVDPRFDGLRDDPRFAAMVRRVGLEP